MSATGPDGRGIAALQLYWDINRSKAENGGIDLKRIVVGWLGKQWQFIADECGADFEFKSLVEAGCEPKMLALLLGALRRAPRAAGLRQILFGSARQREQTIRSLGKTVLLLRRLIPLAPGVKWSEEQCKAAGVVPPDRVIDFLVKLQGMLEFANNLPRLSGVRSIEELARFAVCAYVEDATGRPHNREVAVCIGYALGESGDEAAHAMWRKRNWARLAKALERPRPLLLTVATFLERNLT